MTQSPSSEFHRSSISSPINGNTTHTSSLCPLPAREHAYIPTFAFIGICSAFSAFSRTERRDIDGNSLAFAVLPWGGNVAPVGGWGRQPKLRETVRPARELFASPPGSPCFWHSSAHLECSAHLSSSLFPGSERTTQAK
ncbi:hypothetical protein DACRYDRAFT_23106 [Dacryopinax primogenitus]|uniref:Uncharacterized protein n=1 Tax=Dacryopinax primogenitus (strain DJM 731) TaxID=1858805 RepID=M5GA66_DACPD|nr:uncharacterized protein DACRYDRAFT_23106 [Dacryopinax primogenitus]EJU00773.1 hypothetical protein DACRYDRAFT_23106 [Dacryopinax primogenitus]